MNDYADACSEGLPRHRYPPRDLPRRAATGRSVATQEFAVYRVAAGKITQVWVTADNLGLLAQLR
jgi:hypothetical protein